MKIEFELRDIGLAAVFESLWRTMPQVTAEELARKSQELGKEPLCRTNLSEQIFVAGLKLLASDLEKDGALMANTILKGEVASYISEIIRRLVDLDTLCRSKLATIEQEKGKDSNEWKAQNCILTGVDLAIAQIDMEENKKVQDANDFIKKFGVKGHVKPKTKKKKGGRK